MPKLCLGTQACTSAGMLKPSAYMLADSRRSIVRKAAWASLRGTITIRVCTSILQPGAKLWKLTWIPSSVLYMSCCCTFEREVNLYKYQIMASRIKIFGSYLSPFVALPPLPVSASFCWRFIVALLHNITGVWRW